jgi:hypothetical protein
VLSIPKQSTLSFSSVAHPLIHIPNTTRRNTTAHRGTVRLHVEIKWHHERGTLFRKGWVNGEGGEESFITQIQSVTFMDGTNKRKQRPDSSPNMHSLSV